jgi:small-conductance mechanosensitive channel
LGTSTQHHRDKPGNSCSVTLLPHYHIDQGVQLSITRLVHYIFLLLGFLILLQALGVSLRLTILGDALSQLFRKTNE